MLVLLMETRIRLSSLWQASHTHLSYLILSAALEGRYYDSYPDFIHEETDPEWHMACLWSHSQCIAGLGFIAVHP
jgi:hypothetical protein